MYELIKVNDEIYYVNCPSRVGVVKIADNEVFLVDSGSSKDAIKKIKKNIDDMGFSIKYVVNTHSHADHISGNKYLQENFGINIYGHGIDKYFINEPNLESMFLYGASPYNALKNHFLLAPKSICDDIPSNILDFSFMELSGHSFSDIVIKCGDIWFIGDIVFNEEAVLKYHVPFIFNVGNYLKSLEKLRNLDGSLFIPSHGPIIANVNEVVDFNIKVIKDIVKLILDFCDVYHTTEEIFDYILSFYKISNDYNQSVLVASTIRSFLSYLVDESMLKIEFLNNRLCYLKYKNIDN